MKVNAVKLSDDPLVIVTQTNSRNPFLGDFYPIAQLLNNRPFTCLVVPAFSVHVKSDKNKSDRIEAFVRAKLEYPEVELHAICNESIELEVFKNTCINSFFINQNAFLDTDLFKLKNNKKEFDAVYNAQLKPFKRHHLATGLENIALIYYGGSGDLGYFRDLRSVFPSAFYANGDPIYSDRGNLFKFISPDQVSDIYSRSYAGLCLSAVEGAMYASAEYLLCGIPVVSTKNHGGRNVFANPDHWIEVSDDPSEVIKAVNHFKNCNLDPESIRKSALNIVCEHRNKLFEFMNQKFYEAGQPFRRFEDEFPLIFKDKLWKSVSDLNKITENLNTI